jgi:TRAP-type C4-dicarboxylate transport system permease small subunit
VRAARRLLRAVTVAESAAAAIAYVIVAALLIGDVIGREILGKGIFGASKMAVFAAIIAGFLGLSLATAANAHIRPAFLDGLFRGQAAAWAQRIGDAVAFLFFCAAGYVAIRFVMQSYEYKEKAAVLYWQLWPIQLVIPYAFFSTALRHGVFALWPTLKPASGEAPG